ncbi:MAG: hypothetical protein J6V22_01230 [Clostridia bacterium]|nr:hypothetical protein [Clostridia bacterium]
MANEKYAKAQMLSKREHDRVQALKDDYLQTVYRKKKVLGVWKAWERLRWFVGFLAWAALAAGIGYGFYLWFKLSRETEASGLDPQLFLFLDDSGKYPIPWCLINWAAVGAIAFAVIGIGFIVLSFVCRKKYMKYSTKSDHVDIKLDNLKREKIDKVLENQIVVSVRSIFETLVEYEDVLEGEEEDDDEYEYFDADKVGPPESRVFTGSVDNAIVYIDGLEVGAIDLDSEFSCFRVEPGLHSLKIIIRKEFPYYGKQLVLETPINPIRVDDDYRIVLYTVLTKQNRDIIRYKLKVAEYDDMVIFMRDTRQTGNLDEKHNADKLSLHLRKRARKLHRKIYGIPETEEQFRAREAALYGEETATMEALSKNMGSTYHDARFDRSNKIEISLSKDLQNFLTRK